LTVEDDPGGKEAVDGTSAGFEKLGRARTGQENLGVRGGG
jgi:hypothetical protein